MSERWEDPKIFKINKEDGHVISMPYDSPEKAAIGEESEYKLLLNGEWKFYWQLGFDQGLPEGFYKDDFDCEGWGDITVPSLWQLKGYGLLCEHIPESRVPQKK